MLRGLVLFVVMVWGACAAAQEAVVQSGEHPGFSRLAVPVASTSAWELRDATRGVVLHIESPTPSLDVSRIFDFIPQNRIASVSFDDGELRLDLACDCPVNVFRHNAAFLVVDVQDGEPWPEEDPVAEIARSVSTTEPTTTVLHTTDGAPRHALMVLDRLAERAAPPIVDHEPQADVLGFQAGLSEGLRIGLAQGVLSPREPASPIAVPTSLEAAPLPHVTTVAPPAEPEPSAQLAVQTVHGSIVHGAQTEPQHCDVTFSLRRANWPEEWQGVDYLRAAGEIQTFGNGPELSVDKVEAAAMVLMAIGFGAEARALLADTASENSPLSEVSRIIDGEIIGAASVFAGHHECSSQAALWAIAAQGAIPADMALDEVAILAEFMELPVAVRDILRPVLIRRLEQAGFADLAVRIAAFSEPNADGPVFSLRAAEVEEAGPDLPADEPQKPSIQSAAAHRVLIERFRVQRDRFAASDFGDIDHGFALLNSVSPKAEQVELAEELVVAALLSEQVVRGLELLSDTRFGPPLGVELRAQILEIAAEVLRPAEGALIAMAIAEISGDARLTPDLSASLAESGFGGLVQARVEQTTGPVIVAESAAEIARDPLQAAAPHGFSGNDMQDAAEILRASRSLRAEISTLLDESAGDAAGR